MLEQIKEATACNILHPQRCPALADVVEPPLTTIRQPVEGIAQAAVERLVGRLEGAFEAKPNHQTLCGRYKGTRNVETDRASIRQDCSNVSKA